MRASHLVIGVVTVSLLVVGAGAPAAAQVAVDDGLDEREEAICEGTPGSGDSLVVVLPNNIYIHADEEVRLSPGTEADIALCDGGDVRLVSTAAWPGLQSNNVDGINMTSTDDFSYAITIENVETRTEVDFGSAILQRGEVNTPTVIVIPEKAATTRVGDAATPTPTTTSTLTPAPADSGDGDSPPIEALLGGGAAGIGILGLLYLVRSGDDGADDDQAPVAEANDGGDPAITASSGSTDTTAAAKVDDGATTKTADSGGSKPTTAEPQQHDPRGPPEIVPSMANRSLSYDEIDRGERIGAGGNADVYTARLPDGQQVALKEPRMEGTVDIKAVERFVQEAETWDKLDDHDHVVSVVDYGDKPAPWLVLEYMDAGDMSAVLATEPSFEARVWMSVSICRAVRHAHRRGVAHLDLKPANVLFQSAGESWPVPKVADWGLAKMLLDHSKSVEGFSPNYAAPEQFATEEYGSPDDITDIYQTGAVCYELFTGEPPFKGSNAGVMRSVLNDQPTPPSSVAEVPAALDDVLFRALEKEKADRYESIIELRDALADLSEHRTNSE